MFEGYGEGDGSEAASSTIVPPSIAGIVLAIWFLGFDVWVF